MSTDALNTDETVEVSPAPVRPRIRTRLAGRAPAPPSPGTALHAVSAATAVLLVLVAIGSLPPGGLHGAARPRGLGPLVRPSGGSALSRVLVVR
ncbi:hypothetical protein [Streptomyces formicae]